jgi:diacylglycerol kinase family enzyme
MPVSYSGTGLAVRPVVIDVDVQERPDRAARRRTRMDLILNSGAGTLDKRALADSITAYLADRQIEARVVVAHGGPELVAAVRSAARGDADVVVAGGGDGTILTVARHLVGTDKALGVLPLGTFNYFARNLELPLELEPSLAVLADGHVRYVDVGEVNGEIFLNSSSIGLYPAVLAHRERTYRKLWRSQLLAYTSVALVLLRPPAFLNLTVTADGALLSRRTPLLFVGTNAHQMESFAIAGRECLQNGRLTFYVTKPMGPLSMLRLSARALFRGLRGADGFETLCAQDLLVGMRRRRVRVAMDGELRVLETPLKYTLRRDALRVVAPAPSAG